MFRPDNKPHFRICCRRFIRRKSLPQKRPQIECPNNLPTHLCAVGCSFLCTGSPHGFLVPQDPIPRLAAQRVQSSYPRHWPCALVSGCMHRKRCGQKSQYNYKPQQSQACPFHIEPPCLHLAAQNTHTAALPEKIIVLPGPGHKSPRVKAPSRSVKTGNCVSPPDVFSFCA